MGVQVSLSRETMIEQSAAPVGATDTPVAATQYFIVDVPERKVDGDQGRQADQLRQAPFVCRRLHQRRGLRRHRQLISLV